MNFTKRFPALAKTVFLTMKVRRPVYVRNKTYSYLNLEVKDSLEHMESFSPRNIPEGRSQNKRSKN
jgi:hypothetical protein